MAREPWYLAYERAAANRAPLKQIRLPLPEPLEPAELALIGDVVDTSAAMAGHILKPRAIADIARAVMQLFGIGSPAVVSPATGAQSNP
ncbi:hypothetical protein [Nocardia sp. NPDC046763]|uniref:hypothetical protein n=1 Tax=Nocardia sp. NPDC046763 TaxID=3155256 RepID=UPI0033E4C3C7